MARRIEVSPFDRAYEGVLEYIEAHGLKPGDRLPSERDLCVALDVSRTTLRSALAQLSVVHVVECHPGSGSFVCPPRPTTHLDDLSGFSEIVRKAGEVPRSSVLSSEVVACPDKIAPRLGLMPGDPVFKLRRVRGVEREAVCVEAAYVAAAGCPGIEDIDFARESLTQVLEARFGKIEPAPDGGEGRRRGFWASRRAPSSSPSASCAPTPRSLRWNTANRCTCPSASAWCAPPSSRPRTAARASRGRRWSRMSKGYSSAPWLNESAEPAHQPLYLRIRRAIRDRINAGEFTPGASIPSETDLAQHYGTTKLTIRNAIDGLIDEGLLFRVQGKGTFVTHGLRANSASHGPRGFRASQGDMRHRPTVRVLETALRPTGAYYARLFDVSPESELFQVRRLNCVDDEPFAIENALVPCELFPGIETVDVSLFSLYEFCAPWRSSRSASSSRARPSCCAAAWTTPRWGSVA